MSDTKPDTINNRYGEDLVLTAPRWSVDEALDVAGRFYGISGTGSTLPSERDQNVLIESGDERVVLKIANTRESRGLLEAQNAALAHVAKRSNLCPRVVRALDGREMTDVTLSAGDRYL